MRRAVSLLAVLLTVSLVVFSITPREPEADRAWMARASTYSPGPEGGKALFLLLQQLGLDTQRWRHPGYGQLPAQTVLWVFTREPFGRVERRDLARFLTNGGTLVAPPQALAVVLEEAGLGKAESLEHSGPVVTTWGMSLDLQAAPVAISGLGKPTARYATADTNLPIVAAWRIGAGQAVSLGVDELARNGRIGLAGNGAFLARLALALGDRHVFDEYKTGFGEGDIASLLAHVPYRWGIAQLVLVGAVGLFAFAKRRFPAEPLPPVRRRRTLDHVEAVAQLWGQARDAGLPLQAILDGVAERARMRLGGGGRDAPFVEWIGRTRPNLAFRAKASWERAQLLCQTSRPAPEAALLAAADIKGIEREAMKW
jgi:Domain of unknown function (DUF4350)